MCRMCSTDNEPDSITDDRPEHEPHTVTVCVADNGTHAGANRQAVCFSAPTAATGCPSPSIPTS